MNQNLLEVREEHLAIKLASIAAMRKLLDYGQRKTGAELSDAMHALDDLLLDFYPQDVLHEFALSLYAFIKTDDDLEEKAFGISADALSIAEAIIADPPEDDER